MSGRPVHHRARRAAVPAVRSRQSGLARATLYRSTTDFHRRRKSRAAGQFALPDPRIFCATRCATPRRNRGDRAAWRVRAARRSGDDLSRSSHARGAEFPWPRGAKLRRKGWKIDPRAASSRSWNRCLLPRRLSASDRRGQRPVRRRLRVRGRPGPEPVRNRHPARDSEGDSYLERSGRTILLDTDAIQRRATCSRTARAAKVQPGTFSLDGIYSAYVKSSLDALDGIDVEASPTWLDRARRQNRAATLEPVRSIRRSSARFAPIRRRRLLVALPRECGFCGILADEMGLGKTLQTLAWLKLQRSLPTARQAGADRLPTSLVETGRRKARVSSRRCAFLSQRVGAPREMGRRGECRPGRDVLRALRATSSSSRNSSFAAASWTKRSTSRTAPRRMPSPRNKLKASNRFVLTHADREQRVRPVVDHGLPHGGTRRHEHFRRTTNCRSRRWPEGEAAQSKLRRKLHPFLMRRLKKDVARDLPPKIQRVASCSLTLDQQLVYEKLLEASRGRSTTW